MASISYYEITHLCPNLSTGLDNPPLKLVVNEFPQFYEDVRSVVYLIL